MAYNTSCSDIVDFGVPQGSVYTCGIQTYANVSTSKRVYEPFIQEYVPERPYYETVPVTHCLIVWRVTVLSPGETHVLSVSVRPGTRQPSDFALKVVGMLNPVR